MSELFEGRKPKWPTLKGGAKLPTTNWTAETEHIDTYVFGFKEQPENESGGFFAPDRVATYPCMFYEKRKWVQKTGMWRLPLYYLVWAAEYRHGVIVHIAPQYPHVNDYEEEAVERAAVGVYEEFVIAAYAEAGIPIIKDVRTFLRKANTLHD